MKRTCINCGAILDVGDKLCPNCGRVALQPKKNTSSANINYTAPRRRPKRGGGQMSKAAQSANPFENQKKKTRYNSTFSPTQRAELENIRYHRTGYSGKDKRGKIAPFMGKIIKIVLVLAVLYISFYFVRVETTKHSEYDFKTKMELPCSTYGEAMENYFKDNGSWNFELTRNKVSYTGTKDNDTYVLTFGSKDGQTVVTMLTINGKEVDKNKIMEEYVLGMFMSGELKKEGVRGAFR